LRRFPKANESAALVALVCRGEHSLAEAEGAAGGRDKTDERLVIAVVAFGDVNDNF